MTITVTIESGETYLEVWIDGNLLDTVGNLSEAAQAVADECEYRFLNQ